MTNCCRPYFLSQILFPDPPASPPEPGLCYHYFTLNDAISFVGWTFNGADIDTFKINYNGDGAQNKAAVTDTGGQNFLVWQLLEEGQTPEDITVLDLGGNPVPITWTEAGCGQEATCYSATFDVTDLDSSGQLTITVLGITFVWVNPGGGLSARFGDADWSDSASGAGLGVGTTCSDCLYRIFGTNITLLKDLAGNTVTITITGLHITPDSMEYTKSDVDQGPYSANFSEIPCP